MNKVKVIYCGYNGYISYRVLFDHSSYREIHLSIKGFTPVITPHQTFRGYWISKFERLLEGMITESAGSLTMSYSTFVDFTLQDKCRVKVISDTLHI